MKLLALLILLALRRIDFRHDSPGVAHAAVWRARLERVLLAPLPVLTIFLGTVAMRLLWLAVFWAGVGFLLRFGLDDVLLSWPLLFLYVGLLWILIGRDTLGPDLNEYLRLWYLHDEVALRDFVAARFGVVDETLAGLHAKVLRVLFVRGYRETFVWIVVFAITGLPGLLAFASIHAAMRSSGGVGGVMLAHTALEMRGRLDWLAVRVLGASLLLIGNSARAWPVLDSRLLDDEDQPDDLMADLGVASAGVTASGELDAGIDITDARGLLLRTQVVWAMLMAVSVIAGF